MGGQAGQLALSIGGAVVGGVAGFFIGGPQGAVMGAELGFAAGGAIGGLVFQQKGPNPADIRIQDSAYGKPIPVLYGMYRVSGNMIWAGQPYVEDQGKGGKGSNQQKVAMSFAIAICAGPITGVRRIWANGKLIYDVSNPSNFQAISGSAQMVANFTLYPGDENQQPDPTMQAALGVNATPAYRGLAYVVFNNLDLSTWSNYLPSFSFEVLTPQNESPYTAVAQSYLGGAGAGYYQMPCLTAKGGVAAFLPNAYFWTQPAISFVNVSPYGSAVLSVVGNPPKGFGQTGIATGNSDVPGFLNNFGYWIHQDGSYDALPVPQGGNFWRNGADFFWTGNNGPIVRCVSTSNWGVVASSVSGSFTILGGTASYLYAFEHTNQQVYRLDRNTLATVAVWVDSWGVPGSGPQIGDVLDDDHIYEAAGPTLALFRPSSGTRSYVGPTALGNASFTATSMKAISQTFFVFGMGGSTVYGAYLGYTLLTQGQAFTTLAEIVADICSRAGMTPNQYDVSQLTDVVQGYAITNHSTARSNLMPLMGAYFFDACDTDGLIKFVKRGAQPVGTFAYADLGASASMGDTTNTNPITETIAQEIDLPRSITLTYSELESDYNPNSQRWSRALTHSNKDTAMQVPIVLAGNDALMRAQAAGWSAWVGRKTFAFSTPLGYLQYEPGDVVTLQGDGESYTVRLTRCQFDGQGSLIWQAALEEPDIYPTPSFNVQAGSAAGFATQSIGYSGPTMLAVLDVPPLQDTDTSQGLYLAACGLSSTWPGCAVDVARPGGAFGQIASLTKAATMGTAQTALPNFSGGNQPDELSSVSVVLYSGTLASCSYANFLAGANAAYLGGELIFFRNATQTAANTYTLTGLLRGRGGTENAMSTHAAGDLFVFLDAARVASLPLQVADIGSTLAFETFLLNLFGNTPSPVTKATPANARVKPLSPALFVAGRGSASSTSDISLSWIRRARVKAQWLSGTDVPLDESAETYTLTIYSGTTLKRTATVSAATSYVYTAANITADGFSAGQVITFSVQQNSDQGVLGTPATTTITR